MHKQYLTGALSAPQTRAGIVNLRRIPECSALAGMLLLWVHSAWAFDFNDVAARAEQLAASPFKKPASNLTKELENLDYDKYRDIRFRPDKSHWRSANLPFELTFFHQGWHFNEPVKINEVSPQGVHEIRLDPANFNYGANKFDPKILTGAGFAGFRVHYPINKPMYKDEVLVFHGASYFRALGKNQIYGLSARGLAIDTAMSSGEEFPRFVEFWLERPSATDTELTIYGLLDSPRATGAYRFVIRPGITTTMDVTSRLYLREPVNKLGLAPLTSMLYFGENQHIAGEDYRPEVHDSDGLSVHTGNNEWIWRPLINPKRLLTTSFSTINPRGFGLMQRDRDFGHYEDLEARYDKRPSAWISPRGEWGPGRVELVQIPTPDETNDNIVAYWIPDTPPKPGEPYNFNYRISWQKEADTRPPSSWVVQTRRGKSFSKHPDGSIGLILDFDGPALRNLPPDTKFEAVVSIDANGHLVENTLYPNTVTGTWRQSIRVKRLDNDKPIELRSYLRSGNNAISETWSYILPPRVKRGLALAVCERYLDWMPLSFELRQKLLKHVTGRDVGDPPKAMAELHRVLAGDHVEQETPSSASVARRLELAYGTNLIDSNDNPPDTEPTLSAAPPLNRTPMGTGSWPPHPLQGVIDALKKRLHLGISRIAGKRVVPDSPDPQGHWHRVGAVRRIILLLLVLAQTSLATHFMSAVLPYQGTQTPEIAMLVLFAILCGWVSAGFWTAIMGFLILQFGGDRYAISASAADHAPIPPQARTAIVMPICNEHVARVFAGLRATYESLSRSGQLEHFDFYVLSDSSDPDTRVAENEAWLDMCRRLGCFERVFYRWRKHRIKRKSGNVADFCRRWGGNYRYMVVMDADSVMTGECLSRLVQLMEANPNAGIIQTAPRATGRDTFYARLQQFANRVYGPLFVTGLHFWQLGESHYWGHNAIIRIEPFIRHCALGRLPGKGSLSGEILSHDFVEAALMRRAGWAVWIAYDLPGSYEEMPPNLVDELQRDRRWCHGNLMNFRLFLAQGFHMAHRAVFVTGVIAYVSAFVWFMFLLLSTWLLAQHTLVEPEYFTQPKQLFPLWPEWHPDRAIALFSVTAIWLFLPKLLSVLLVVVQGAKHFGGAARMVLSMFIEWLFSMLLAPIRMLFHTQFVVAALIGWRIQWQSPPREDAATSWQTALRRHGGHTLLGIAWAGGILWLNPSYLLWLLPVVGALTLSIPLSVYSSSANLGRQARKLGLFLIPEESSPPPELQQVANDMAYQSLSPGFVDAVTDPTLNALLCALSSVHIRMPPTLRLRRMKLVDAALRNGPHALANDEKMVLLNDSRALSQLHFMVWSSPDSHEDWFEQPVTAKTPPQPAPQPQLRLAYQP